MGRIIPIRISEGLVIDLDELIQRGTFRNRNEGIRAGLRALITHYREKGSKKKDIARIIANYIYTQYSGQVHTIVLFGSVAQDIDNAESDIDLFVLTQNPWSYAERDALFQSVAHLIQNLDVIPSLHFEDVRTFSVALNEHLIFENDIYKKGIVLRGNFPFRLNAHHNVMQSL